MGEVKKRRSKKAAADEAPVLPVAPVEHRVTEMFGACPGCGAVLTSGNSCLENGARAHLGCPGQSPLVAAVPVNPHGAPRP